MFPIWAKSAEKQANSIRIACFSVNLFDFFDVIFVVQHQPELWEIPHDVPYADTAQAKFPRKV